MALAATVDADLQAVRLDYTVADDPAGTQSVTLTRRSPSGAVSVVRGWQANPVNPGPVVARDFEAPIGLPLTYTAQTLDHTGAVIDTQTASITIPSGGCSDTWLNDLARVGNTLKITIESLPELAFGVQASVHEIITRRDPIVTSDIAHTPSFELSVLTVTPDDRDRARAILGNGVPVLLRTPPEDGVGNLYFAVLNYAEQRLVPDGTLTDRRFVIGGRQVTRPDPGLYQPAGFTTYQYVKDTFATYAVLKAQRATYDAVLYDWEGLAPSDIVPWPPVDA